MAYIRDNEDWYAANGDTRSYSQRAADIEKQLDDDRHMPDSVREDLQKELDVNRRDADRS